MGGGRCPGGAGVGRRAKGEEEGWTVGATAVALGIVERRDLHIGEADWPKYVASGIPKYNFVAIGIPINIRIALCSLVIRALCRHELVGKSCGHVSSCD